MKKIRRNIHLLLLIAIGVGAYWFVINKMVSFGNYNFILQTIQKSGSGTVVFILLQIALFSGNLFFESYKWHTLIGNLSPQPFWQSLKQVLGGLSAGTMSPARIAEPIGKLVHIDKKLHLNAIALSVLGSITQSAIILIAGTLSIILFGSHLFQSLIYFTSQTYLWLIIPVTILPTIMLTFWYKPLLKWLIKRFKLHRTMVVCTRQALIKIMIFTILRYCCFAAQLIISLWFFNSYSSAFTIIALTPLYLLIISLVPTFFISDLGVRGTVSVVVFTAITTNPSIIITAIFFVWLINVAFPALLGLAFLPKLGKEQ